MNNEDKVYGRIAWLKCEDCLIEFPTFVFSGDTDMATDRFRTFTDLESKRLFIYDRSIKEHDGVEVDLVAVERVRSIPGESFQDFQERNRKNPPKYLYRCIACSRARAEAIRDVSEDELAIEGYSLVKIFVR